MASLVEIKDQLRGIITPDLLLKVYKLVIRWHKSCKLDWEEVGHNLWGFVSRTTYTCCLSGTILYRLGSHQQDVSRRSHTD